MSRRRWLASLLGILGIAVFSKPAASMPPGSGQYRGPGDTLPPPLFPQPDPAGPLMQPILVAPGNPSPSTPDRPGPTGPYARASATPTLSTAPSWAPASRKGAGLALEPDVSWTGWWWRNAFDYFRPLLRSRSATLAPAPGDSPGASAEEVREALLSDLDEFLADRDASIRSAAVLTAARVSGALPAERWHAFLEDPASSVRAAAILGGGLSGDESLVPTLLGLALEGRPSPQGRANSLVQERDRALSLVALGASTTRGVAPRFAPLVRGFAADLAQARRRETANAAFACLGLVANPEGVQGLLRHALDQKSPAPIRARALWAATRAPDPAVRPVAEWLLDDGDPDLRRAAALALGRTGDGDSLLEPLLRAVEGEGDGATRGFALLALGEGGGPKARDELLRRATRGKALLRPWAALGAGIAMRREPFPAGEKALLQALAVQRDPVVRAAFEVALGLARTTEGLGELRERLAHGESLEERAFAATAIALAEDGGAREALRRSIASDPAPGVRATASLALSVFREPEDEACLADALRASKDPSTFATTALALAWHGSPRCLEALLEAARGGRAPRERAVALLAVGLGLDRSPVPELARLAAWWNFLVDEEFAREALLLWS